MAFRRSKILWLKVKRTFASLVANLLLSVKKSKIFRLRELHQILPSQTIGQKEEKLERISMI
ncbi:hypothetical protein A3718_07700 [Erythrobacter sp. HI0019]|nr:hypothetical protein ED21_22388 [Erythrobacter sp. SD-21]KZX52608.1 hypothetical protein A3711_06715 [Erythrobacter sp. HI00D59]KZX94371.1 hypothetical protein A3718_07700 [Erythrobacter sp. HI0019]KZY08023.1 hypothetical protein A3723_02440 [Erythrobacter sp. HI0028]KZZ08123.1 hypothetical protein A3748_12435 [Erythrobacter sp. HI0077]OAN85556.1 hypothetical protein A8B77_09970 [Erythrobacter sp. EhN03]